MMNINEYFHNLYQQAGLNEDKFNAVVNLENEVYEMDEDEFTTYCSDHNIDLTARDECTGELIVTLWDWDMCDE